MSTSLLFSPLKIRSLTFSHRIFLSPMCQYSAKEGVPQPWHLVHLGARAQGGAALTMVEATGVTPEGRISPGCLGIWNEEQELAYQSITAFILSQGSVPGIQLAHAGRKASTRGPLQGSGPLGKEEGAWQTVAPSAVPYKSTEPTPHELTIPEIERLTQDFLTAASRAQRAGFQVIEIHMAHGYLLHEFLSPLSNFRRDNYGGSLENRMRFPLQVAEILRKFWPQDLPVFVRISATDWVQGGWDLSQCLVFVQELKKRGIDLIDVSSGGLSPEQKIIIKPGYQVDFSHEIRKTCQILTGAVGLITEAQQAEEILRQGSADAIFMGRELLRNPSWPQMAAHKMQEKIKWPWQYERAKLP